MSPEKRSEGKTMQDLVAAVAGPRQWGDSRQSWLARAARRADISYRQAKALFYGEITDPDHKAARRMREAAGRHEARQLATQFETIAQAVAIRDPDFHSEDIASLVHAARLLRGLDRPGTGEE